MKFYKKERLEENPKEKEFLQKFILQHYDSPNIDLIVFGQKKFGVLGSQPNDELTEREKSIVLATIQWLGSPVGQSFLLDCGFKNTRGK